MTDSTLRSLERAALTGDLEAETRLLVARLRAAPACERCDESTYGAGTLRVATTTAALVMCPSCAGTGSPMRARVELAAYCKSESARAALGDPPRSFPIPFTIKDPPAGMGRLAYRWHVLDTRWDLGRWVRGLSRWSDLHEQAPGWVLVRAAVAAARLTKVAPCGPVNAGSWGACCPMHSGFQVASATAGAWLACPCDEHAQACREASLALDPTPSGRGIDCPESAFLQALAAIFWRHEGIDARTGQRRAVDEGRAKSHAEHAIREAVKVAGEQAAREAIALFLRSWALGEDGGQSVMRTKRELKRMIHHCPVCGGKASCVIPDAADGLGRTWQEWVCDDPDCEQAFEVNLVEPPS